MSIPLIIVICYLVAMFGASIAASIVMKRRTERAGREASGQGFLEANRGLTTVMVAAMIACGAIGGSSTLGVAQNAYTSGFSGAMYTFAWFVAALVLCFVVSNRIRHLQFTTFPGLFYDMFGPLARVLQIIGQLVVMFAIVSLQFVAGGNILYAMLPTVFPTPIYGMILTAIVFVAMTVIGGMLGAGFTNIINAIVIYVGLIGGAIAAVNGAGGWDTIATTLTTTQPNVPWFSLFDGLGIATIIGWVITQFTAVGTSQQNVQIIVSAQSDKASRRGMFIGAWIILPCGFVSAVFGLVAAATMPGIPSASAMPMVAMTISPILGGILLSGLWAADISTGVNLLLGIGNILTHDILDPVRKKKSGVSVTRVIIAIVGFFALMLALNVRSILNTLMTAQCIFAGITIIFFVLLYKPSWLRKSTANATMIVGYIILILWLAVPATHIVANAIYLEWPICILVFILCMVFDKRMVKVPYIDDKYAEPGMGVDEPAPAKAAE